VRNYSYRWPVLVATAMALLTISVAQAAPRHSAPTLGVKLNHPGAGFGQVRPGRVDFGGDPTSFVSNVKWSSWGGKRAVGHGRALWVWPGWCVACGGVSLPATVVAFGRTRCEGHSAYSRVEWFFPSRGQSFDPRLAAENICNGRMESPFGKQLSCGHVLLRSNGKVVARAESIDAFGTPVSCPSARQFVASSGAARYLGRNARFTVNGWWCGSQLNSFEPAQMFSCARGDFVNVFFELKRA
jgi:hypothetical protein